MVFTNVSKLEELMEQAEEKPNSNRKSILSLVALVGVLFLLMYAAPMLQQKLGEWSDKQDTEETEDASAEGNETTPEVASELTGWLKQVTAQLPKNDDGSARYRILHMRLRTDGEQLLLDMIEQEGGQRFDLILRRDEFGRYISEHKDIPLKLYPPEK